MVDFLRGKNGPKVRRGILNGKRIDYFKGKSHSGPLVILHSESQFALDNAPLPREVGRNVGLFRLLMRSPEPGEAGIAIRSA